MILKQTNPLDQCLLKFDSSKTGEFSGYASTFNGNDLVNDTILPGAFKAAVKNPRAVKGFYNHDHSAIPIIDWLSLSEDSTGLAVVGRVDLKHYMGVSLHSAMERGAVDGMSIGFRMSAKDFTYKDGFEDSYGGNRIISNVDLREVSVVTAPCDPSARIEAVKSDLATLMTIRDFENFARDVLGMSKSMATAYVSQFARVVRGEHATAESKQQQEARRVAGNVLTELRRKIREI